jgi:hypothetical protein
MISVVIKLRRVRGKWLTRIGIKEEGSAEDVVNEKEDKKEEA